MSGIAALFRFDGGPVDRAGLQAMLAAIAYRGPDGCGMWSGHGAAIGLCAMHATMVGQNAQPITSDDGELVLAFDGYIGNVEELRRDLAARGSRFRGGSDAELALRAYEQWGGDFAGRLEGEFAAVLWDGRRRQALCARDHHGLRPLYWHWDGQQLIAASEIAAVLATLPVRPPLNLPYLAEIAADAHFTSDETVWQGIRRLRQAHVLLAQAKGVTFDQYWSLPVGVDIIYRRDEDYHEHYREVLSESVRRASRTHLPLGCEVSGGLDSSSIYCLAHRLQGQGRLGAASLRGYSLAGPAGTDAEEIAFARVVGSHTGTQICERPLFLPPLEWFAQRSAIDCDVPPLPNAAMSITLDEAAVADGCRVSLSGVGGDQWCDGTYQYYGEQFTARDWRGLGHSYAADVRSEGVANATGMLLRLGLGSAFPAQWRRALRDRLGLNPPYLPPDFLRPHMRRELAERRARYEAGFSADYRASYKLRKLHHPIWTMVLDQNARQRARTGLEMRHPMMSRAFIEFSARTPERLKLHGGVSKHLHRNALREILPDAIANRQSKAEFSAAYDVHFGRLRESAARIPRTGLAATLLDPDKVMTLYDTHLSQPIDERGFHEIWGAYVVNLMAAQF